MSGAPTVRSMSAGESEARPVLGPAGNKARSVSTTRKPALKNPRKVEKASAILPGGRESPSSAYGSSPLTPSPSAASILRRQELLLHSNLSLNASFSSDCSTDSFRSRASTGRIGASGLTRHRKHVHPRLEKGSPRMEKVASDGDLTASQAMGKKTCSWVTPNVDPLYAAFHDEEWGVPVHEDKKLFELLVLSSALGELTWPAILGKRQFFREVFAGFDPVEVSKMNEKKMATAGSPISALLSEAKVRAAVENARQVLKITEEFGSFDRYCWGFVSHRPIVSRFRYPRQVPVKTPKADVISKDMVRRGLRCVGPTVVYSFMQAAGITNDHLVACHRFAECCAAAEMGLTAADPPPETADGGQVVA